MPEAVDLGPIELGDTVDAELEAGKRSQFTLEVKEGEIIDIIVSSEEFDPTLAILDEAGNLLAANENLDDNSNNAGFTDLEIPLDLTLVLHVLGPKDDSSGAFTISTAAAGD
jgi:hypothetical protein